MGLGGIVNKGLGAAGSIPGVSQGIGLGGVGLLGGGGTMVGPGGAPAPGIAPAPGAAGAGPAGFDMEDFITNNPQYKFLQSEGIRGLERSAAAKGGFGGGGLMKDLTSFSSGLASQSYNTEMDRIMKMAGVGAGSPAAAGQTYGQQAGAGTGYGQEAYGQLGGIFDLFS